MKRPLFILLVAILAAIISLTMKWPELQFWYHTKDIETHRYYYYYGQPSVDHLTYDKDGRLSAPPPHWTGGQVHALLVSCNIPENENPYEWKPSLEFVNHDIKESIEVHGFPVGLTRSKHVWLNEESEYEWNIEEIYAQITSLKEYRTKIRYNQSGDGQ